MSTVFFVRAVLVESCKNTRKQKPKKQISLAVITWHQSISEISPNRLTLIYEKQIIYNLHPLFSNFQVYFKYVNI